MGKCENSADKDKETLRIRVMKSKIQICIRDAVLEINRHPFYTNVRDIKYYGDGNTHFITDNDIELLHLPTLIKGEPPLFIKSQYGSIGKQYSDEELLDLIQEIL